jgi:hypothetical protein
VTTTKASIDYRSIPFRVARHAWVATSAWAVLTASLLWGFTADDSYIVYRYADNFASGHGLVYNTEEHVSALTSPLHAIICSLLAFLPFSIVLGNKVLSLALVLAASWSACRQLAYGPYRSLLVAGFVVGSPHVIFWSVGGLETPYLLCLLIIAYCQYRRLELAPSLRGGIQLSVICGLCFLLRFDSILFSGPLLLHAIIRLRRQHPHGTGTTIALFLPALFLSGSWLLFSSLYYHDIFPTSYYSKGVAYFWYGIAINAIYILQFLAISGLPILLVTILLVALLRPRTTIRDITRSWAVRNWGILAGLALSVVYALGMVTSHMMFGYRFLIPFLPILLFLLLDLLPVIRPPRESRGPQMVTTCLVFLLLQGTVLTALLTTSFNIGAIGEYRRVNLAQYRAFMEILGDQAKTIQAHWGGLEGKAGLPTVYVYAAGIPGYELTGSRIVDSSIISYRHYFRGCASGISRSADYLFVTSRHGVFTDQLGGFLAGLERLESSNRTIMFDGKEEEFVVYYNPDPSGLRLPPYIDGAEPVSSAGDNSRQ